MSGRSRAGRHARRASATVTVYGELVSQLRPVLTEIIEGGSASEGGGFDLEWSGPDDVAAPLVRAIMRAEAELLLHDAALVGVVQQVSRTDAQRQTDAFVLVFLLSMGALELPGCEAALRRAREGSAA